MTPERWRKLEELYRFGDHLVLHTTTPSWRWRGFWAMGYGRKHARSANCRVTTDPNAPSPAQKFLLLDSAPAIIHKSTKKVTYMPRSGGHREGSSAGESSAEARRTVSCPTPRVWSNSPNGSRTSH
jgi:hypothetical protein